MIRWMESHYAHDIENHHYRKVSKGKDKGFTKSNAVYVLRNKMVIDLEADRAYVSIFCLSLKNKPMQLPVNLKRLSKNPGKTASLSWWTKAMVSS
jgi:hypothetical protein